MVHAPGAGGGKRRCRLMRARTSLPLGVFGAVATPGRPLSPLSAARASPVAARRGGSLVTPPSVRPPALSAQHLGDLASLASPSGSFSRWVVDRRRAAGYRRAFLRVDFQRRAAQPYPPPPPAGGMFMGPPGVASCSPSADSSHAFQASSHALRASPHALRASPNALRASPHALRASPHALRASP